MVEDLGMEEELISRHFEVESPVKNTRRFGFRQICTLLVIGIAIVSVAVLAFASGWLTSWIANDTLRNKSNDGAWVSAIDNRYTKVYTPIMEIADSEVQIINAIPKGDDQDHTEARGIQQDDGEQIGDRTILKDPVTKNPLYIVDREFLRDSTIGHVINELGEVTDDAFCITITEVASNNVARIIPFSVSAKGAEEDDYATLDVGANPTFYFLWNNNSKVLKPNSEGELEASYPISDFEIEKANTFLKNFQALYEPFLKAQRSLSLDDDDLYVPEYLENGEISRSRDTSIKRFEVSVDGEKKLGWYVKGNCWVTNCRPTTIISIVYVSSRNKCGLWFTIAKWIITIIPARCHTCSRCNAKCNGYPSSDPRGCSNNGKCVQGKCQCNQGFAGAKCNTCACRYNPSSYPRCDKCLPKYGGSKCSGCSDGYWPSPLCSIKRKCGSYYFDDSRVCSKNGKCSTGIGPLGSCTCNKGFTGKNCEKCATNFTGTKCDKCISGYYGTKCTDRVRCGSKYFNDRTVCSNNGKCVITGSTGKCQCNSGWQGADCNVKPVTCNGIPSTSSSVCGGRGTCQSKDVCKCQAGYEGKYCQTIKQCNGVNFNSPNVCSGCSKGSCDVSGSKPVCKCKTGWSGNNCQTPVCQNNCNNRGTCNAPNKCSCNPGYFGASCEKPRKCGTIPFDDKAKVCNGKGDCIGTTENGTCKCNAGWTGANCNYPTCKGVSSQSKCVCGGKGKCVRPDVCQCDDMFTGTFCDKPVQCNNLPHTSPHACGSFGTCQKDGKCKCNAGVTGAKCDSCVNPRADIKTGCTTCLGKFGSFPDCKQCPIGYGPEGDCSKCVDGYFDSSGKCSPCGCSTQGSVNVSCNGLGKCTCKPGYTGDKCNTCTSDAYRKGSECVLCNCSVNAKGNTCDCKGNCVCKDGYVGAKCSTRRTCNGVDYENASVCGGQGACTDVDVCACKPGFFGKFCQTPLSCNGVSFEDTATVCNGRGSCIGDGVSAVGFCSCSDNWTGESCEIPICDGLAANMTGVCHGHGSCEGPNVCKCTEMYTGTYCADAVRCNGEPYTSPLACGKYGTCTKEGKCDCEDGIVGGNCSACENPRRDILTGCTTCESRFDATGFPDCKKCPTGYGPPGDCTQCASGFYVLNKVCVDCGCSSIGSSATTCSLTGKCTCKPGYTGRDCSECTEDAYRKDGACVLCNCGPNALGNSCDSEGECACPSDYSGKTCDIARTCFGIPFTDRDAVCSGHGTCTGIDNCTCEASWTGEKCEVPLCFGIAATNTIEVCEGHGKCIDVDKCECTTEEFSGEKCHLPMTCGGVSFEDVEVCNGHGRCVGSYGNTSCECEANFQGSADCSLCTFENMLHPECDGRCKDGYAGETCESCDATFYKVNNKCVACGCNDEGSLADDDTCSSSGQCNCRPGRYGLKCELACECNPAGVLSDSCTLDGVCQCDSLHTGDKCEVAATCRGFDYVSRVGCNDHGNCIGQDKCVCDENFEGDFCEKMIKPMCNGVIGDAGCKNNGTCTENGCECKGAWEGPSCETEILSCNNIAFNDATVCSGKGACVAKDVCECNSKFIQGKNCETEFVFENGKSDFLFGTASMMNQIAFGPFLEMNGATYKWFVEIKSNGFQVAENGMTSGIAGFPLSSPAHHKIGTMANEFAYSSTNAFFFSENTPIMIQTFPANHVGYKLKFEFNTFTQVLTVHHKLQYAPAYEHVHSHYIPAPRGEMKYRVAMSAMCRRECIYGMIWDE